MSVLYTLLTEKIFCEGMRDGIPIALGYLAVSFSLGIAARNAGLTALSGISCKFTEQCFCR